MLNFKVYWSILGTYFILVRASTCLVFWIESSKSFEKSLVATLSVWFQRYWQPDSKSWYGGNLFCIKLLCRVTHSSRICLLLGARPIPAPVHPLQWFGHLPSSLCLFWSVLHTEGQSRPRKSRSTTLWVLKESVFAQRSPSGSGQDWRRTPTVKSPSLWTLRNFLSKSRSSHARRILSLVGRQTDVSNNFQRWSCTLFSLEEMKTWNSSKSQKYQEEESTLSRSQKYGENKPTFKDSTFPVGANASLMSQNKFSFDRDLLISSYKCWICDKYLSIKLQKAV